MSGQVDNDFWFVAPEVTAQHGDTPILLRFASFDAPASIVVDMPANPDYAPYNLTLDANSALSVDLTDSLSWYENWPADIVSGKGIHITSSANIAAYYEVNRTNNPDIFALKGDNALGTSFHLPFQNFTGNGYAASTAGFDVVATQDNTTLTIVPSQALVGHVAGVPFSVFLPFAGSTYCARAVNTSALAHPTGTSIVSDRPVAVTLHDDSAIGNLLGGTCQDLMGDQMVPDNILGTEYIPVRGYLNWSDHIEVCATQDNTTLTVDGVDLATLDEGESYEYIMEDEAAYLQSTLPVAVWQSTGFGCELGGALLPSVKCTGSYSVVFVRSTAEFFAMNLLVPAGGEGDFTVNGATGIIAAEDFATVPGNPAWMFAQIAADNNIAPGGATRIENEGHVFHLGIINGGASSGTRYGYFSDYGELKYQAVNQQLDPCLGDLLELSVDSVENGLYQWTGPNEFNSTGLTVDVGLANESTEGTYVIQGYTGECAIENDTIVVVVHAPQPAPVASGDVETCEGQPIPISASGTDLEWTLPDGSSVSGNNIDIDNGSVEDSGVYVVTVVDPFCPSPSDSVNVNVVTDDELAILWEDEREFCQGEEVVIGLPSEVFGSPDVQWILFEEGSSDSTILSVGQSATVSSEGLLVVISYSDPPCSVRSEGIIEVTYAECDLIIPNVVTTNDDNLNNRFAVRNLIQFPNSTIRIFNRWGGEVFRHDDFGSTSGWLPTENDSEGTYYFVLHIERTDQITSITSQSGTSTYEEPGSIDLQGSFMLFR